MSRGPLPITLLKEFGLKVVPGDPSGKYRIRTVCSFADIALNLDMHGISLVSNTTTPDPRDALVMKAGSLHKSLDDLPAGSVVGTSSVRRSAQIAKKYPEMKFADVRGNM